MNKIGAFVRFQTQEHPVRFLLFTAAAIRLLAVLFAKGFMASDDYFVYLHIPWLWSHGYKAWFDMDHPSGFSIIYPGLNYLFILAMRAIGLDNPDGMMYVNRALHAAWSLVGIYYAYKLALLITNDKRTAFLAGLVGSLFSFLPYGSVRNLPEMVCLPFVMMTLYYGERAYRERQMKDALLAGLAIGASFLMRYQSLAFGIPIFFLFLFRKEWRLLAAFSAGAIAMALVQGFTDQIAYGKFFGAPLQYFFYNVGHSSEYVIGPWYRYLLLFVGIFIPPFSLYFLSGVGGTIKKAPVAFWATVFLFVLHSFLPAKQERFVIPAILPVIVLGCCGIYFLQGSKPFQWLQKFSRPLWIWFWIGNAILLILFTFHYGKRGQIEALNYLYRRGDAQYVLVDRSEFDTWLPCFYLDIPENHFWWVSNDNDWQSFYKHISEGGYRPAYELVTSPHNIQSNIEFLATHEVKATVLEHYGPGLLEWLLWKANPKYNAPNDVYVLKLEYTMK